MHSDPAETVSTAQSEEPACMNSREVAAVILAAGRGTRLGARCKPLAIVGGLTLLERAVVSARTAGIGRVVVVVAALDGEVAAFCRAHLLGVELVAAADCVRGNGATVAAGLSHAGGRCVVMMVDHLHEPATFELLLAAEGEFVFVVDSRPRYMDVGEATLVRRAAGSVVAIDKQLAGADAAEAGLAVCAAEPLAELAASLDGELEFNRLKQAWLATGRSIGTVDIAGAFWVDIDTPEDRRRAIRGPRRPLRREGRGRAGRAHAPQPAAVKAGLAPAARDAHQG
jgi:choline kinase